MAKVFVDTNVLIDLIEKQNGMLPDMLGGHILFLSPLSLHILIYVSKRKVPSTILNDILKQFTVTVIDEVISQRALEGPTEDFEDNVQLHCSVRSRCEVFLTQDKKLLNMKFFGKARIDSAIQG